jgi:poly [ADP-ribose] polymerase 2/3/4
MIEIDQNKAMA